VLGYRPILAIRANTGEVVHARVRKDQALKPAESRDV
jgi:hypothetical protein